MGKMRQIFVALVSLYVGLVYGFIVPSGGSEEKISSDLYEIGGISNYTKLKKNILNKRMESSLLNDYNIDKYHQNEKDLFEYIKEKENNVSERSLILLSQKIKKTLLNKLFNNKHKTWSLKYEDEFPLNQLMAFQKPKDTEKTYFQPNIGTKIPKVYEPVDCLVPNHRCNKEIEIEGVYDDNNDQMQIATEADVKGDRVQLFKPSNDSIKSFINKVKTNDYKDNENNRIQIKTPMNVKPTDYMSKYELLQPINKVLSNKLQYYRTYTNDIPNGRPLNKEDKLYRIKVDKKMNLRVDSSEEKSVPSISYSKNYNHHPLCSKIDGHHINNTETAQNKTCKCSVTEKKETKQKELNSFPTQESRLEDTYMDLFLDILRA